MKKKIIITKPLVDTADAGDGFAVMSEVSSKKKKKVLLFYTDCFEMKSKCYLVYDALIKLQNESR